jgi:hypothetical protein
MLNEFSGTAAAVSFHVTANPVPARAQMAATLGFHIILACLGSCSPRSATWVWTLT